MYNDEKNNKRITWGECSGPYSVAFTITSKCNFYCRHCYNNSGEDIYEDLSDAELLKVAEQICELNPMSVCLCGGEPLIRGRVVYEIVKRLASECGIVNIVTNGSTVNERVLEDLKVCGVNTIQISLDGDSPFPHENIRMKRGAFTMAINAIRLSAKKGFRVAVSCCPSKLNKGTIEGVCKLVKGLGANELRLMPLILMGRGENMSRLKLDADEYLLLQQQLEMLKKKYQDSCFSISWGDPLDHLFRMPQNSNNNMSSYSMEIRSDGKLSVSTYLPIVVGDVKKHSLREYWEAGYKDIWGNNEVKRYISSLYSTNQFNSFKPKPYKGEDIEIDLIV